MGDPSPEAWSRVHRYASWMRQLCVDDAIGEETFRKLNLNAPADRWFPVLQDLSLSITRSNLPYTDLFLSPHLKRISISMSWSWGESEVSPGILQVVASTISALPAPTLQDLSVSVDCPGIPPAYFEDSLSSIVLRCGPSLVKFSSPIPLSDTAINHLIHLPSLRTWHIKHPPPSYSASPSPLVFPPLTEFIVGDGTGRGWISLLERLGDHTSSAQGTTPLSRVRKSLKSLTIGNFPDSVIDISLASVIRTFRNLAHLNVVFDCLDDRCVFKLNDDNVTEIATALPRLESLLLGYPCGNNTCATTVVCLLQISTRCPRLQSLEIHFNTTNIVDDLNNISEDPRFEELRLLRKCAVSCLDVNDMTLPIEESDFETVANGMMDIFPELERCDGWEEFSWQIAELREMY